MTISRADLARKYHIAPRGQRQAALKALQAATHAALASDVHATSDGSFQPRCAGGASVAARSGASSPDHHLAGQPAAYDRVSAHSEGGRRCFDDIQTEGDRL